VKVLHPSCQSVVPLARRCAAAIAGRCRATGVTLTVDADPATPTVRMDVDRIAEAITNLLDNALRHTPLSGRITLTVAPYTGDAIDAQPMQVKIEVRDTGDGFDPTDADRLFERFYRSGPHTRPDSSPGGGSGIGLTIARAIVEAHRGQLRAHSDGPDTGATFTIILPADIGH